jgi:hypothetical protein
LNKEQEKISDRLKNNEYMKNLSDELDTEITFEELKQAAKNIKTKKATYSDKISNEMIKHSVDSLGTGFINVFNSILKSGNFPSTWCEGLISPIFKSGYRLNLACWQNSFALSSTQD